MGNILTIAHMQDIHYRYKGSDVFEALHKILVRMKIVSNLPCFQVFMLFSMDVLNDLNLSKRNYFDRNKEKCSSFPNGKDQQFVMEELRNLVVLYLSLFQIFILPVFFFNFRC